MSNSKRKRVLTLYQEVGYFLPRLSTFFTRLYWVNNWEKVLPIYRDSLKIAIQFDLLNAKKWFLFFSHWKNRWKPCIVCFLVVMEPLMWPFSFSYFWTKIFNNKTLKFPIIILIERQTCDITKIESFCTKLWPQMNNVSKI